LAKVPAKFVDISASALVATNENQTVLLIELGFQQPGVDGFPLVVAATLVYKIELQVPTPSVKTIAVPQVSFDGCAYTLVLKLTQNPIKPSNFKYNFILLFFR